MVGDLQSLTAGPPKKRTFCTVGPRAEIAVLSINSFLADGMRVSLHRWDARGSAYVSQFACYVLTAGRKVREVQTVEGKPANRALRAKLGRALNFAAHQFENGIL
jgi:hypothetical protein